jgi:hypothetical protein
MSTGLTYQYLEARPKSPYRQLFIKGTRIQAESIYRAHINADEPRTAEELAVVAADIAREDFTINRRFSSGPVRGC